MSTATTASLSPEQETLKETGNAALKNGDSSRAMECFSSAIALQGGNDAGRAVLYSNRCATHLTTGQFQDALQDAEQCVKLNPSWVKGWSRKGAALFGLRNFKLAALAYRKAASLASGDEVMRLTQLAFQCEANAAPQPATTTNNNTNYYTPSPTYSHQPYYVNNPPTPPPTGSRIAKLAVDFSGAFRVMSIFLALAWIMSGGQNSIAYPQSLLMMGLALATEIAATNGPISLTQRYLLSALESPNIVPALVAMSYAAVTPVFPAIMAVQILHLKTGLLFCKYVIHRISPPVANRVADMIVYSPITEKLLGVPEWRTMDSTAQAIAYDQITKPLVARLEISVVFLFYGTIFMAMLTARLDVAISQLVGVMIISNVAKVRYMQDAYTQQAWSNLDSIIRRNVISRVQALATPYGVVYKAVCWFAQPPGADTIRRGGIPTVPKCVVM